MPNPALAAVGRVARALDPDPPADADLLTRFAEARDEAAFAELLRRHGPVVLGVARRILADPHDADDAFQAVFVVLARRAGAIRPPGQVGPWLYGVAVKTATKAKIMAAKRRQRELASGTREGAEVAPPDWSDLRPVIDEELARLPDKLRSAVVLCDLGGKSRSEAARELGLPEGTVATRLAKARELLAARLTRRGVTLPAAGVAALFASGAAVAAVPPALASAALAAALGGSASAVPPSVQLLADGVVRSMYASYWKLGAAVAVALGALAAGSVAVTAGGGNPADPPGPVAGGPAPAGKPAADPPPAPAVERNEDLWVWQERPADAGLTDHGGPVRFVAFAPDGKAVYSAGSVTYAADPPRQEWVTEGGGYRWELPTFRRRATYRTNQPGPAAAAVAPDGGTVALATADQVWVAATAPYRELAVWKDVGGSAAAFSPDGKRLAVTDGRRLWVRDLPPAVGGTDFGPLAGAPKLDGPPPAAVAWAPDGKRVVFLPNNKIDPDWPEKGAGRPDPAKATHWYAQVWGAGSGEAMQFLKHGTAQITALAWSADGKRIATADAEGGVALWDGGTFKEVKRLKAAGPVTALAFRADGKRFAAGVRQAPAKPGDDLAVRVEVWTAWDGSTPDHWLSSSTLSLPTAERVTSLAFAPDGKVLVAGTEGVGGTGGTLRVWDRVFVRAAEK